MKINIYKNQKEVAKTYEVDEYDIMYGTVQDILAILDEVDNLGDNSKVLELINQNRTKIDNLMLDIFGDAGLTKEELRMVKVKELIPVFIDLFIYVQKSFKSKN